MQNLVPEDQKNDKNKISKMRFEADFDENERKQKLKDKPKGGKAGQRGSSREAKYQARETSKSVNLARVDHLAAALILQTYLNHPESAILI